MRQDSGEGSRDVPTGEVLPRIITMQKSKGSLMHGTQVPKISLEFISQAICVAKEGHDNDERNSF